MKEYEVTMSKGFSEKKFYTQAESAEKLQQEIEQKFAYELHSEGLSIKSIKVVSQPNQ